MDKNNDGLIPREDFIQGIMNTSIYYTAYFFPKQEYLYRSDVLIV